MVDETYMWVVGEAYDIETCTSQIPWINNVSNPGVGVWKWNVVDGTISTCVYTQITQWRDRIFSSYLLNNLIYFSSYTFENQSSTIMTFNINTLTFSILGTLPFPISIRKFQ
jgi:hypothetical protein